MEERFNLDINNEAAEKISTTKVNLNQCQLGSNCKK